MSRISQKVLVLNQSYEPMSICDVRKAIILVFAGKAEMVAAYPNQFIRSVSAEFPIPSVVRLMVFIAVPYKKNHAHTPKHLAPRRQPVSILRSHRRANHRPCNSKITGRY
jgi:hypothetical protein